MFRQIRRGLSTRRDILGINARNLDYIYPYNRRPAFPNVDDKIRCKSLLAAAGIPVLMTFHVVDGPETLSTWQRAVEGVAGFVIKPNRGYGGKGILLLRRRGTEWQVEGVPIATQDITFYLMMIRNGAFSLDNVSDTAYLEELVENHPDLDRFFAPGTEGIADIRLIYRNSQPIMGMVRLPTKESGGRANLHQGGIGVGIDLENLITTDGCQRNSIISRHPETGQPFRGHRIPFLEDMLAHGARTAEVVGLGYIGIDFVCDHRYGPVVLEVNARPGLNIQLANQRGLRKALS